MVTLAICWKAIGAIALIVVTILIVGLIMKALIALTESDLKILRVLGWVIWIGIVFVTLLGTYSVFAETLCR